MMRFVFRQRQDDLVHPVAGQDFANVTVTVHDRNAADIERHVGSVGREDETNAGVRNVRPKRQAQGG